MTVLVILSVPLKTKIVPFRIPKIPFSYPFKSWGKSAFSLVYLTLLTNTMYFLFIQVDVVVEDFEVDVVVAVVLEVDVVEIVAAVEAFAEEEEALEGTVVVVVSAVDVVETAEEEEAFEVDVVGEEEEAVALKVVRKQLWNHIGMKVYTLLEVLKMPY